MRTIRLIEIGAQEVHRGLEICIGTGMVDFSTISTSVWLETAKNDEFSDFAPQASYSNFSACKMHPATCWLRCSPRNRHTSDSDRKIHQNFKKITIFPKNHQLWRKKSRRRQAFQPEAAREGSILQGIPAGLRRSVVKHFGALFGGWGSSTFEALYAKNLVFLRPS